MPSINGGMKLVKYGLFLFNILFVCLGIVLIYKGFQVKYGFTNYFADFIGNDGNDGGHSIPPTIFIAIGFIMFVIAFLGCCGAVTENHCMMMLYSVLIGLILVIQLGAAIAAYAFQDDVEQVLSSKMENSLKGYYNETSPTFNDTQRTWNVIQHSFKCCGVHSYADWADVPLGKDTSFIPESCCIDGGFAGCTAAITRQNYKDSTVAAEHVYIEGCLPKGISSFSIDHMGTIGISFAVVELLGVICACMMARSIRFSYETV